MEMFGVLFLLSIGLTVVESWTEISERGVMIPFDLEANPLQIQTNSTVGSGDIIYMQFKTDTGRGKPAGGFMIHLSDTPAYKISFCSWEQWTKFTVALPGAWNSTKTWTITKATDAVSIACNGVKLAEYTFAESNNSKCLKNWANAAKNIKFAPGDTASQAYRVAEEGEYVCIWEGSVRNIGDVWDFQKTCETCTCVSEATVVCNGTVCSECPKGHVPVEMPGECCSVCLTDWLNAVDNKTVFQVDAKESVTFGVEVEPPVNIGKGSFYWEKRRETGRKLASSKYVISEDGTHLTVNNLALTDQGTYRVRACFDEDTCEIVQFSLSVTPSTEPTLPPSTSLFV